MDLKQRPTGLPKESFDRVSRHIDLLFKAYCHIAEKHVNSGNEADFEEYAQFLLAFSRAIFSHLKRPPPLDHPEYDATLEELCFFEKAFQILDSR